MEGTLRIHVERKKSGSSLTRPTSANIVNNTTTSSSASSQNLSSSYHGQQNKKIPHHLRDTLAEKYDVQRKIASYVGGKTINIGTKVLPVCDFDAGSVVYLRESCFDIDKDIMLVEEDVDNNHNHYSRHNHHKTKTTTTATITTPVATSNSAETPSTDLPPDGSYTRRGSFITTNTRRGSFVHTDKLASFSLPPQLPTGPGTTPVTQLPWSSRQKKPPPTSVIGAYELIFEFVVPTTMIVIPRLRLESAITVTQEEVKNRQSTMDIEGIEKWVYRAETMVIDRISSLSSWLQGGGVTVDRKKTHVLTLREITHRKHWCFDGFIEEEKKIELKDIVEQDERDRYEHILKTEKLRMDMQSVLMTNPNALHVRNVGDQTARDVAVVSAGGLEQVTHLHTSGIYVPIYKH